MHIHKLLLQLNILRIGFEDHAQVYRNWQIFFRTSCECSHVDPRAGNEYFYGSQPLKKAKKEENAVDKNLVT
jgi:hypothetical protein